MEEYNKKISEKWSNESTERKSELFFALSSNKNGEVFMFWDNARGNESIIDYLKQVVKMLEQNKNKNFSTNTAKNDND